MRRVIDAIVNWVTMYRLVLYVLIALIAVAMILSYAGFLPYDPLLLLFSALFITVLCLATNIIFSYMFDAPANVESVYITALILVLIITPPHSLNDRGFLELAFWASVWSMASKYILAIGRKHIFNPAAFAVALTALTINASASWWVATPAMLPFVLAGGLLITRKILRFDLVISFMVAALIAIAASHLNGGLFGLPAAWKALLYAPVFYFAFVMLTEPLTTPPTRPLRIAYGLFVGILFAPAMHIGPIYSTPELALLAGNVFSYIVSPKAKLMLRFKKKEEVATDTFDFYFETKKKLRFKPGQYLEWTLPHARPDSRGNRRTFTIASSPTETDLMIGVKFYSEGSSFKEKLQWLRPGDTIVASQLAGDFTLPHDKKQKLVFITGGIGVTPFRSMIKYLLDSNENRDIVMLYSNRTVDDIAYKEIFDEAMIKTGIKVVYTLTDASSIPNAWNGNTGYIDEKMIRKEIPDFSGRHFYVSGPQSMVRSAQDTLIEMGIPESHIKKDFFPGFA